MLGPCIVIFKTRVFLLFMQHNNMFALHYAAYQPCIPYKCRMTQTRHATAEVTLIKRFDFGWRKVPSINNMMLHFPSPPPPPPMP